METFTVSRDDGVYEAFPDVALSADKSLVCVFTECNHHGDRLNSRIMYKISRNNGRAWSEKHALTPKSDGGAYYNCARIRLLRDGRLAVVCDRIEGEKDTEKMRLHLFFSYDNGLTWSEPIEIRNAHGLVPDRVTELASGRLIVAAHHPNAETGRLAEYAWISDDGGKSWSDEICVASDGRYNLCEASLTEISDNVLVAYMRENSSLGIDCLKAISEDGGLTWRGVFNVPLPACHRPTAGLLADGRILITYRFMQGGKGWLGYWTQNTFGAIMPAESALAEKRNEQSARIFPISFDRSPVSDTGYTGWVQLDGGKIYVVNYIVDDAPKAFIKGFSFETEEFLL